MNNTNVNLFKACESGNFDYAADWIERRIFWNEYDERILPNLDFVNDKNQTPLFVAALNGHSSLVTLLADYEADTELSPCDGHTPLWIAARAGNVDVVNALLDAHAEADAEDFEYGATPYMVAAANGHDDVIFALSDSDANCDARDNRGDTALIYAIVNNQTKTALGLIEAGAQLEHGFCESPITLACENNNFEIVEALIEENVNINIVDSDGNTPLIKAVSCGHNKIALLLIKNGADVNAVDSNGYSALYYAFEALEEYSDVVVSLLHAGANPNITDKTACDTLLQACGSGCTEMFKMLLASGVNTNVIDEYGLTPLHVCAHNFKEEHAKILFSFSVDPTIVNKKGQTARDISVKKEDTVMIELLDSYPLPLQSITAIQLDLEEVKKKIQDHVPQ